ncbi:RDD family protein [Chishuiella changwenlii]|uniref:RDD family protein n=1 Tax=Chishuiella changwenlii TaxID=1434701 RepID=UPI002FD922D0
MYQDYAVGEHKANKGLRFLNYLIDLVAVIFILAIVLITLTFILGALGLTISEESILFDLFIYVLVVIIYFLIEFVTKGRSLGKLITGTKVVMIDGTDPTTKDYFVRNLCRIIPFDALTFLGENGWHDKISKTTVVRKRAFEEEMFKNNSIDEIGRTE